MHASQSRQSLVAVDTNVLLDLAADLEDVTDAMVVIRRRLREAHFLMPPTVREELAEEALHSDNFQKKESALRGFQLSRTWNIQPVELFAVQHEMAGRISRHVRSSGLLPREEVNDGLILAEAALLGCSLLLTSDEHLRGIDFERLSFELNTFGIAVPVIATPREIVQKFFR